MKKKERGLDSPAASIVKIKSADVSNIIQVCPIKHDLHITIFAVIYLMKYDNNIMHHYFMVPTSYKYIFIDENENVLLELEGEHYNLW